MFFVFNLHMSWGKLTTTPAMKYKIKHNNFLDQIKIMSPFNVKLLPAIFLKFILTFFVSLYAANNYVEHENGIKNDKPLFKLSFL